MKDRIRELWNASSTPKKILFGFGIFGASVLGIVQYKSEHPRKALYEQRVESGSLAEDPDNSSRIPRPAKHKKDVNSFYGRFRTDRSNNMWVQPEQLL